MARIILETEDNVKRYIQKYAEERQWTMSVVLRGIINEWIEKSKPLARKGKSSNGHGRRSKRSG